MHRADAEYNAYLDRQHVQRPEPITRRAVGEHGAPPQRRSELRRPMWDDDTEALLAAMWDRK